MRHVRDLGWLDWVMVAAVTAGLAGIVMEALTGGGLADVASGVLVFVLLVALFLVNRRARKRIR